MSEETSARAWLGSLPDEWSSLPLRRVARVNPTTPLPSSAHSVSFFPMEEVGHYTASGGGIATPLEHVRSGFTRFVEGDVLVAKITPSFENGKGAFVAGLLSEVGFGTTELHVLRPFGISTEYLSYVMQCLPLRDAGRAHMKGTAGQKRVTPEFLKSVPVPVPPESMQRRIVQALRNATQRIDGAIAAKKRVIELLKEERQAVVSSAVSKGTDRSAPLTDTGLACLPLAPVHWTTIRTKYLYTEVDERSSSGDEELLSVSHLTGVGPRTTSVTMFKAESYVGHKLCRPGDLVINTMWAWMGALGVTAKEGIVSPSYSVYRPIAPEVLDNRYADALLRTPMSISEYARRSTGIRSSRLRLYPDQFLDIKLPIPPKDEQGQIVEHLASATAAIDERIETAQQQVQLLEEYRTVLIADAVTGKLDLSIAGSSRAGSGADKAASASAAGEML